MKFRKKPVVIEAVQIPALADDLKRAEFYSWINERDPESLTTFQNGNVTVTTAQSQRVKAAPGEWIIPDGRPGRFYPCDPDIFAATYELADEAAS